MTRPTTEPPEAEAPAPRKVPPLTHPHARKMPYQIGDRVLLKIAHIAPCTEPPPADPWVGAVVAVDPRRLYVQHEHQEEGAEPLVFSRRGGGQVVDLSRKREVILDLLGKSADDTRVQDLLTANQVASKLFGLGLAVDQLPLQELIDYASASLEKGTTRGGTRTMLETARRLARALQPFQAEAHAIAAEDDMTATGGVSIR